MRQVIEIREAYGDDLETVWIVTVNGWQVGGEIDHRLGCGTAEFPTYEEAKDYMVRRYPECPRAGRCVMPQQDEEGAP